MSRSVRTKPGLYEIVGSLGSGGMGDEARVVLNWVGELKARVK